MNFNKLVQVIILCFVTIIGFTQVTNKDVELLEYDANEAFENHLYEDAINYYVYLDSVKPNNSFYNLRLGKSYDDMGKKELAKKHYEVALRNDSRDEKIPLYLAKIEHHQLDFEHAVTHYQAYLSIAEDSIEISKTKFYIHQCENAIEFSHHPMSLKIENLGPKINSEYPEYAAIIDSKDSTLVYTARRKVDEHSKIDMADGKYYEDVYISKKDTNGEWTEGELIKSINTKYHEASVSLSADAKRIYFYRSNNHIKKSGIYESTYEQNEEGELDWSTPKFLNKNINQPNTFTPSVSVTSDGERLYFSSDRPGGLGGLDLYMSEKMTNGEWGPATNLGPTINTSFDEDAPFIHHSDEILVFSSKGHNSIGGYDNFYCVIKTKGTDDTDEVWEKPHNFGVPINSTGDDIFFVWAADESKGYFASTREGGYGDKDIYVVHMPEDDSHLITMKGYAYDSITNQPLNGASIIANKKSNGEFVKRVFTDKNGKYVLPLRENEEYSLKIDRENYLSKEQIIKIEDKKTYYEPENNISLLSYASADSILRATPKVVVKKDITAKVPAKEVDMKIVLRDVLFDFNKSTLQEASYEPLNKLAQLISKNKTITVQIIGHTDSKGKDSYNQRLSEERAQSVLNYLVKKKGINKKQFTVIGKGETEPYTSNESESGRKLNRRVEFKIMKNK